MFEGFNNLGIHLKSHKGHILSLNLDSNNEEVYKLMSRMATTSRTMPVKIGEINTDYFKKVCERLLNTIESQGKKIAKGCPECGSEEIIDLLHFSIPS